MRTGAQLGLWVVHLDRYEYKVQFSNGISLFTWGEKINVSVGVLPDGRTGVHIESVSNLGVELAAKSRNEKNVLEFVNTLNYFLPPA